ncbi:putative polysaccharide biosynthesis protein [Paenibacillus alginolyticus]|uniref:Polysaccharide biosynthesis protein n=1 Tax=Paenibacillus alginolyticus TaxID=59839 RepID=A0ABT4GAU8_9BACL|nr:polysaccharide biosynthesis protein [Paenibacillus alginolyticus]MCY9693300.1 polysaccharide biosynthesis protein [Paenibacillus alginolyticus]MEC0145074.1 polysaccharide biosynthesis protein [Paenibacillus alginolyticus]
MTKETKDSLVKGTLILTVAALIARFLGVFQRIPLVHLLHEEGMGSYSIAFNLYSILLVVATAGIPSALSKMVSEKYAIGRPAEAQRIYRAAIWFAIVAGVVMTAILYVFAPIYAEQISHGGPDATLATRAIAPAMLFFPLIAIMRGYFQGRQNMMPNGISQVVEQVFRLVTSIGLAFILLNISLGWGVAGASFGGVMGGIAALAVMLYYALKLKRRDAQSNIAAEQIAAGSTQSPITQAPARYSEIYRSLLKLSIPIVIFSVTVTLVYAIDTSIIIPLLEGTIGRSEALGLVGIIGGRAQSLAGIPIILAIALSQSVVPIISAAYSRKDLKQVGHQTTRVLQLSILSGLPAVLVIAIAARPLDFFMFGHEDTAFGMSHGPYMISLLTLGAMFQIVMQTSGAVLMGMGRMKPLMTHVAVGIAVKLAGSFLLAQWFGIYGIIGSTGLCFIVMSWLNLRSLRKEVDFTILGRRFIGLLLSIVVIVILGLGAEWLTHTYVHPTPWYRLNEGINAVLVCGFSAALYPLILMVTRVVTKDDVKNFPSPVQKLIGKVSRLLKRS